MCGRGDVGRSGQSVGKRRERRTALEGLQAGRRGRAEEGGPHGRGRPGARQTGIEPLYVTARRSFFGSSTGRTAVAPGGAYFPSPRISSVDGQTRQARMWGAGFRMPCLMLC